MDSTAFPSGIAARGLYPPQMEIHMEGNGNDPQNTGTLELDDGPIADDRTPELVILEDLDARGMPREAVVRWLGYSSYSAARTCAKDAKMSGTKRDRLDELLDAFERGDEIPFMERRESDMSRDLRRLLVRLGDAVDEITEIVDHLDDTGALGTAAAAHVRDAGAELERRAREVGA